MAVMKPAKVKLVIYQGATYWKEWIWKDANEDPINLTNYTARMQIREEVDSEEVLLEILSSGTSEKKLYIGGKVEDDPTNGKYGIWMDASVTAAITFESGVYDIELEDSAGYVRRIMEGKVQVSPEVTRPTS